MSSEQPGGLSRTGSFGKGVKLGVAFDPSAGPAPAEEGSKVCGRGIFTQPTVACNYCTLLVISDE